jgi:hypothetical protein
MFDPAEAILFYQCASYESRILEWRKTTVTHRTRADIGRISVKIDGPVSIKKKKKKKKESEV